MNGGVFCFYYENISLQHACMHGLFLLLFFWSQWIVKIEVDSN